MRLSPRETRAVALGAMFVVPAAIHVAVVRPLVAAVSDVRQAVAIEREALRREQMLVASAEDVRGGIVQATADLEEHASLVFPWTMEDGGPTAAALAVEAYVESAALAADVWVDNMGAATDSLDSDQVVSLLAVRLAGRASPAALAEFMALLESGEKLVTVSQLRLLALPVTQDFPGAVGFEAEAHAFLFSMATLDGQRNSY